MNWGWSTTLLVWTCSILKQQTPPLSTLVHMCPMPLSLPLWLFLSCPLPHLTGYLGNRLGTESRTGHSSPPPILLTFSSGAASSFMLLLGFGNKQMGKSWGSTEMSTQQALLIYLQQEWEGRNGNGPIGSSSSSSSSSFAFLSPQSSCRVIGNELGQDFLFYLPIPYPHCCCCRHFILDASVAMVAFHEAKQVIH